MPDLKVENAHLTRSQLMSRIKSKNTKPELIVRHVLHASGYRFRLHRSDLPGRPDIVLPKYKTVIFVNGCFWHRHSGCIKASVPKTNPEFWKSKFSANIARDHRNTALLQSMDWKVLIIWECETKDLEKLSLLLDRTLKESAS